MKKILGSFLCLSLLWTSLPLAARSCESDCETSCFSNAPGIYIPRSPGFNLVTQNAYDPYQLSEDCFFVDGKVTYGYHDNFNEECATKGVLGSKCLTFQGSQVSNRNSDALLADYFGLAPDTDAQLGFCPDIESHVIDFQLHFGLDEFYEGLFAQINAPLVHTKWELNAGACDENGNCESCDDDCEGGSLPSVGTQKFAKGAIDAVSEGEVTAHKSFKDALSGKKLGDIEAWKYGKFNIGSAEDCDNDETELADLSVKVGLNFYECPDYHLGAYLRASAPTGTERDSHYATQVFKPAAGLDHWTLGAGLVGHTELYNCDDEHIVNLFFEGYLAHAVERCQARTFDFANKGNLNRYMLLKEFNKDNAYAERIISATTFTTRNADVQIDFLGEAQAELRYYNACGFSAGLGASIWGKDCEDIKCIKNPLESNIDSRKFGIKGTAPVQGDAWTTENNDQNIGATDLSEGAFLASTQSNATINAGGNVDNAQTLKVNGNDIVFLDRYAANNTTAAQGVTIGTGAGQIPAAKDSAKLNGGNLTINNNNNEAQISSNGGTYEHAPVLVSKDMLDKNSAAVQSQVSGKIFGHANWEWEDCDWMPYVRVGAEVEFTGDDRPATMESWGIYAGGGISF